MRDTRVVLKELERAGFWTGYNTVGIIIGVFGLVLNLIEQDFIAAAVSGGVAVLAYVMKRSWNKRSAALRQEVWSNQYA